MTIVESKELIVTKIIDLVKNNPKISQKDVVSLVLNAIESESEEDKTLILHTLNNLVQNKVLKRINVGRKVTYSFLKKRLLRKKKKKQSIQKKLNKM